MTCLESAVFSIDLDDDHIDDAIYQEGGSNNKQQPNFITNFEKQATKQENNAKDDLNRQRREQENLNRPDPTTFRRVNGLRNPTNPENEKIEKQRHERRMRKIRDGKLALYEMAVNAAINDRQNAINDRQNAINDRQNAIDAYETGVEELRNKTKKEIETTKKKRYKNVTSNTQHVNVKELKSKIQGTKEEEAVLEILPQPMPEGNRLPPLKLKPIDNKFKIMEPSQNINNMTERTALLKPLKPERKVPPTPPPGGAEEKTATSLQNVRFHTKELFDTEHTYVNNLKLIIDHLQRYKNVGIQIRRQNIVSKSFNPILEQALRYLFQMYQVHNFSYIGKNVGNNARDEEIQKNDYVNRFLTLKESQNRDAFNWLSNIKTDRVKELYIKYNFIFDYLEGGRRLQINENSKEIKESELNLNSFLIMPPQRFMRYNMLFGEIIKYANEKDKNVFQTHRSRFSSMLTDINDFKIYFTKPKFETLYEEGQKFINTHLPNGLYRFPFHLYDEITADDEEKINDAIAEQAEKVENMKKDFLEIICNGVLASSINKGKVNESKCETKTKKNTMFYDIRAAHADLQKQLKELETSNDESLFEVYIREVNKKVTGNGCQDILMKLIVLEQASTIYIARCIKSKYPTVLFSYGEDSKFSGLWEKDKKVLQEDKIKPQRGGDVNDEAGKYNNNFEENKFREVAKKMLAVPEDAPRNPPENNLLNVNRLQNPPDPNQDLIDNSEKEHRAYKENSMVYQLIKEQMKVNKEILGFQPEITNLDAMFDFKKIDQIVDDFDTSKMDQKILSKYFDESVQMKQDMNIKLLENFTKRATKFYIDIITDDNEEKIRQQKLFKKKLDFLVTIYKTKRYPLNYSQLYALDDEQQKVFTECFNDSRDQGSNHII